jgi:hypothetical protein
MRRESQNTRVLFLKLAKNSCDNFSIKGDEACPMLVPAGRDGGLP